MTQPPVSPIPPVPGGDRELHAQVERLEALVRDQQQALEFLRTRTGWVLLWAVLATLGSCGAETVNINDGPLRSEVEQTRQSVDQVKEDVTLLRDKLESGELPRPARSGG